MRSIISELSAAIAQPVERILGKDEVASSNLASSSKTKRPSVRMVFLFWTRARFEPYECRCPGDTCAAGRAPLTRYLNIIGNITMFIPVGLAWPFCFKKLDTLGKTVLVGAGFPLFVEITQLAFYDRCSDIDDIILNTTGIFIGALIYFGVKRLNTRKKRVS